MSIKTSQVIDYGFKYDMTGSAAATHTITEGDNVVLSIAGYARSAASPVAGEKFLGVAAETVQNSGSAGAKSVKVQSGIFQLDSTGTIADTAIGSACYVHNATKVAYSTLLTGTNVQAGVILDIAGTNLLWVKTRTKEV